MTICISATNRPQRAFAAGTTYYANDPASSAMEEAFISGGTTTWRDYIEADGGVVALRNCIGGVTPCTATPTLQYFTADNLGSISVIADLSGCPVPRH